MNYVPPPSNLPPGSIVDAYLRDSGGEGQDRSVSRQLEAIQTYCKKYKLTLRHVFQDAAKSGGSTAGRDGFDRLIASTRLQAERPTGLLLWNYARFARDLDDSTYYKALLRSKRDIIIHSLTDQIPEGPYGRFVEILIDISNEEKRRQTSVDTQDGLRSIVAQGAVPGVPPRGFKRKSILTTNPRTGQPRKNHRWVPDPKYKARILKAFQMRATGASLHEIQKATRLYSSVNSYATFWRNRLYYGTLEYGGILYEKYCEPIVPKKLWDKVQLIQDKFAQGQNLTAPTPTHPRRASSSFLLSGLARCARCGSPLYGHTSRQKNGHTYQSYFCTLAYRQRGACTKGRIPRPALEHGVITALTETILTRDYLEEMHRLLVQRQAGLRAQTESNIQAKKDELAEIKRQLTNTAKALARRPNSDTLLDNLDRLELQKKDLETQIAELLASLDDDLLAAQQDLTTEAFDLRLKKLVQILKGQDEQKKKFVLRGLIAYVDVEREEKQLRGTLYLYLPLDDNNLPPESNSPPPADDDDTGGMGYNVPSSFTPSGPLSCL